MDNPQSAQSNSTSGKLLNDLVLMAVKEFASDLHLSQGKPPVLRVSDTLIPVIKFPPLEKHDLDNILNILLSDSNKKELEKNQEVNLSYSHDGVRLRCNVFTSMRRINIAMRLIPTNIKTFEELNLPSILASFARKKQGFFLIVGPTGVGKSTTMASMVDTINKERLEHIITIEDPIENVFKPNKSIISQREVKIDTPDFQTALRGTFRQDADVIMIGEMRDRETISTAVTAAETGHLILSTLHTNTAAQTIDRITDSFPSDQQDQMMSQLSGNLLGIFSQRLVPRISGGLIPAFELLINNAAVANLIRERRTQELNSVIETSSAEGMIDLNRHLADLIRRGEITVENARLHSTNTKLLEKMM